MESRLPKPNFQFKVPARTVNGSEGIALLKTSVISNASNANVTSNGSVLSNASVTLNTNRNMQNQPKTINSNAMNKAADENKAPLTRAARHNAIASVKSGATLTRGVQKRPGLVNNVIETKRANLKTTMKPTAVRPLRPATTAGSLPGVKSAGAPVVSSLVSIKPVGPKPSKWDLKGRLEYTTKELTALKQQHREITTQYNDIQDEIINLRDSERSNRTKAEKLQVTANELSKEVETLKGEITDLKKERDSLIERLQESKDMYEKTASCLKQYEDDLNTKAILLTEQSNEITQLKNTLEIQEKDSSDKINALETRKTDLEILVQNLDVERRVLHNSIQELKGNIRVFCRVRPKISKEASKRYTLVTIFSKNNKSVF